MKKLISTLFLVCLAVNTYQAFNLNNCIKDIKIEDLNSKNLLTYIKENDLVDKITQICSNDLCSNINISTLEQDIKDFINRNLNYLKSKGEDYSLEADLKGFRIDKILINDCL